MPETHSEAGQQPLSPDLCDADFYAWTQEQLDLADLLADNPSLQSYLEEALHRAYLYRFELAIRDVQQTHIAFS